MRVIFLDFDGVLNASELHCAPSPLHPSLYLVPTLVERVDQIAERTDAVVVLSTSWRTRAHRQHAPGTHMSLDELREALRIAGLRAKVIDVTPDLAREDTFDRGNGPITLWRCPPRRKEIAAWVERHKPDAFVILDDDEGAWIDGHSVEVEPWHGIQSEDVERAVRILEKR